VVEKDEIWNQEKSGKIKTIALNTLSVLILNVYYFIDEMTIYKSPSI
jgi:hypothetical protein